MVSSDRCVEPNERLENIPKNELFDGMNSDTRPNKPQSIQPVALPNNDLLQDVYAGAKPPKVRPQSYWADKKPLPQRKPVAPTNDSPKSPTQNTTSPSMSDSPKAIDELDKIMMDLWIQDPYKVPYTEVVPKAKAAINQHIRQVCEKVRIETITKLMSVKTEGLFDGVDLFIKQAPLKKAYIDLIGYESFKAIQESLKSNQVKDGDETNK